MPSNVVMPSEKQRLYIAVYPRSLDDPGSMHSPYNWALLVGPKHESSFSTGVRFRIGCTLAWAGNPPVQRHAYYYDVAETPMTLASGMLVRVAVAKVRSSSRLAAILDSTPIRIGRVRCHPFGWLVEALGAVLRDRRAVRTQVRRWSEVFNTVMWYVCWRETMAVRGEEELDALVPTWNMMDNIETVRHYTWPPTQE